MNRNSKSIGWGMIIIAIGLIFILNNFGVIDFWEIIGTFWPLLLIWWGFTMIRCGRRDHIELNCFEKFGSRTVSSSSPDLEYSCVFGDIRVKVESREFSGGTAKNVFGKLAIDLGEVERITGPGRLYLNSVFGDILIRLPEGLAFEISGNSAFGTTTTPDGKKLHGETFKSPGFDGAVEKLLLHVSQVFGDIELTQ